MEIVVDILNNLFGILFDIQILGMPILVWAIMPVVLGLIISFLKGKKD